MRNNKHNIILSFQNITLFLKNLNAHFTGVQKIITLSSAIIMLSFTNTINTSALDYSSNVDIGFTFLPKLSITLSNPSLTINNLVPGGNAVDSNTITINVSTNIAEGYNLFATVGGNNNTNNGYNTTNLVNTIDNNYTFTSLSSNVSELSSFTNNTWGYSYCISNCSSASTPDTPNPNWISGDYDNASTGYNGLPLYTNTGIKLVEKADSTNSTVNFKIAARASNTQPSGEYTNVINFTAVSNTIPTTMLDAFIASGAKMHNGYFKMQDMTPTICKSIDTDGEKGMQLIDVRDDKVYWVAKLKDNNCWMTQNLDLDLSHEIALTSETSDIDPDSYGKTIYTAETGYSKDETTGIVSWLPSTIDGEGVQRADTIVMSGNTAANWTNNNNNPYSADPGERYRYTNPSSYVENNYTSLQACTSVNNNDIFGCQHTHFGNYYNWPAVIASNNATITTGSPINSVCPKNWDLPVNGKYGALMQQQGVWSGSSNAYVDGGFNLLRTSPLYFEQFGYINDGSLSDLGSTGLYWSSTIINNDNAYNLIFKKTGIWPGGFFNYKCLGRPVRCMVNAN